MKFKTISFHSWSIGGKRKERREKTKQNNEMTFSIVKRELEITEKFHTKNCFLGYTNILGFHVII